jgi:hypothetical protein
VEVAVKRVYEPTCDGSGTVRHCETRTPHGHCACGLPMAVDARQCSLCVLEGTVPLDVDQMEWDGRTYPSWRNHRRRGGSPDAYLLLARAIGGQLKSGDYTIAFRPRGQARDEDGRFV